jgi:hypothetical protein
VKRQAKTYTSTASIPRRRRGFAVVVGAGLFDSTPTIYHHFKEARANARATRVRKKIIDVMIESLNPTEGVEHESQH